MRLGIDTPDPRNALAEIFLDGQRVYDVIEVDEEKGELKRYLRDASGAFVLDDCGVCVKTETLKGAVVIVLPSEKDMEEFLGIMDKNSEDKK